MGGSIDPLLGIVEMKKASGVVLASDQVPALLIGGARSPLTMPPLSAAMLDDLLADLLSAEERATLTGIGSVETTYRMTGAGAAGAATTFLVRARLAGANLTLTLTKGGARSPAPSSARPPAAGGATPMAPPPRPVDPPAPVGPGQPSAVRPGDPGLAALLDQAVARRASDVLLSAGSRPHLRLDGALVEATAPVTSVEDLQAFFQPLVAGERWRRFEADGHLDFAFTHPTGPDDDPVRIRANLFRHAGGLAAALRTLPPAVPTLAQLQLPESLTDLCDLPSGLVLVTGASGSGKSTTLAALLEHLNRTRPCHIVTLEDPIEYVHRRQRALIHQREVGEHVDSFAAGLRAALRENPDVLLVGEMRDAETIRLTLTAALTGHLVLSTLHSGSAIMAIERVIDVFGDSEKLHVRQELAASLRHVVAQRLLPGVRGGRIPALELLTVNHAVAAQIRDGRTHMMATQMEIGGGEGMIPLERTLADLVRAGRITRATAVTASSNREALQNLLDDRPRPRGS